MKDTLEIKAKEIVNKYLEEQADKLLANCRTEMERMYPAYLQACRLDNLVGKGIHIEMEDSK